VERVQGIGGTFVRARDAGALRAWYAIHLGVQPEEWGGQAFVNRDGDQTVWAVFAADTDYFGKRSQQWMLNYRVRDLDAMLAQLRAAGAEVDDRIHEDENGRFGWAADPEGNRFELWQPR
jgi:predicted enzyme related to lactoylglutathione lyase